MEEVKCSLLGFHSALLQQPLAAAAGATVQRESLAGDRGGAAGGAPSAAAAAALRQYCETLPFHPTEQLLLQRALPLGRVYHSLLRATQAAAVGRTEGLYPAAIASGVKRILGNYAEAVKAAETPSALAALPATYELTFTLLERMVQQQQRVEECLPMLDCFLRHQEVPPAFRRFLGESVWLALLYTTAHYVAHGVVLHARPDYFVALRTKPAEGAPAASGGGAEEHVLFTDRLPPGVSTELGLLILAAGKERRVLLRDTDVQGGSDYLEQLALGSQDEAANAVFHSIFNAQLCHGGVLAAEELAARVEAAKTLWSRALWMKVGDVPALKVHLGALRSMFLCHRGDVWYAFVERVLPALAGVQSVRHGGRRDAERAPVSQLTSLAPPTGIRIDGAAAAGANEEEEEEASGAAGRVSRAAAARAALLQRTTADAFFFALSVSNLRDVAAYDTFTMRVAPASLEEADAALASVMQSRSGQHPRSSSNSGGGGGGSDAAAVSTEDMARHLLLVVQALHLQCIPPQGLMLVVSPKAMQYYQRLFSFHLALRFSLEALAVTRSLFAEALVTNACPSPDLRRAFSLFQLLHFMESSIGYYMQVDVISVCTAKLEEQLASAACTSVDQAKRFHDQFIWRVSEATFLTEGSEPLLRACQSLNTCATTLYTLCMRYRIPYWAVEGVNDTPVEVRATLSALEARVQQEVVAVFTGHLGLGARPWERALWSRLDFNAYFSQTRARPAVPVALRSASASATTFAHPRQTRPHGTSTPSRTGSATAAAATTRRHTILSKRASGG